MPFNFFFFFTPHFSDPVLLVMSVKDPQKRNIVNGTISINSREFFLDMVRPPNVKKRDENRKRVREQVVFLITQGTR